MRQIARFILLVGPCSSVFDLVTFAVMWHGFGWSGPEERAEFRTGWFVESLVTQTLAIHVIRRPRLDRMTCGVRHAACPDRRPADLLRQLPVGPVLPVFDRLRHDEVVVRAPVGLRDQVESLHEGDGDVPCFEQRGQGSR